MERALLDYLEDILGAPASGRSRPRVTKTEASRPANVMPLELARPRPAAIETPSAPQKNEIKQNVTRPFKQPEQPRVLPTLNLLNLKPPPQPEKTRPERVPVKSVPQPLPAVPVAIPEPAAPEPVAPAPLPPEIEFGTHADNDRPAWAQERFECLIFNVAGLKLAVPLITLGAIHKIDRKLNALPHQSDWFIGILQTATAGNIKVLDTALCVMPERHTAAARENLAYVITLHGYRWGLACHEVEKSITLEPRQVKWRSQRGKRPWLAGTVIDHMCALIDTDGFRDVIQKADQSS